jgi:NADPH:quinone reductase-like Zn-dependent oxidoreductase
MSPFIIRLGADANTGYSPQISMKAILIHAKGGPESCSYGDTPVPLPAEGEVLVAVHAAGVTPTELSWMPTWTTPAGGPRPFPIIPGHEFSGVIKGVGPGVIDFAEGDAVFGMNDWFRNGAQAEYSVARAVDLAPKPPSIDHVLAALTPISALTAWQALFDRVHLEKGERVLIHGAAGGVGSFAVQLAHRHGAHVIATASAHNLDFVRSLGADEVIDYRSTPFEDMASDVDVVFDTVGGKTLDRSWGLLGPGGRLTTIAAAAEQTDEPRVREAFFIVEPNRAQLAEIARLIASDDVRPIADAIYPLAEATLAYQHKPVRGKVVLSIVAAD